MSSNLVNRLYQKFNNVKSDKNATATLYAILVFIFACYVHDTIVHRRHFNFAIFFEIAKLTWRGAKSLCNNVQRL